MRKKTNLSLARSLRKPEAGLQRIYPETPPVPRRPPRRSWTSWLPGWQFWTLLFGVGTIGTAITASAMLLSLPSVPNCPRIFWPTASASMRLYCGQLAASKNTVDDILEAIALVSGLPEDHGLRPTINAQIEEWTQELLELAETSFHEGRLTEAIDTARRIPTYELSESARTAIEPVIEQRVEDWKRIWTDAEDIYAEIEDHLQNRRWNLAFSATNRLRSVENQYWRVTRQENISKQVQQARDDTNKLANARSRANRRTLDDLLEAIGMAEGIALDSFAYSSAQDALKDFGRMMLDLAQAQLDAQNLTEAIAIARRVPASTQLKEEANDFVVLARGEFMAWQPSVRNLENAISQAQRVPLNSPLYGRAQTRIREWQGAIDQVAVLERARNTARTGSTTDLTTAIAQAELISNSTPVYDQAQEEINRWRTQLQTRQDQPILQRAQALAQQGNYQQAIAQAQQIGSSRALYNDAQTQISGWQRTISEQRDRPILNRAQGQANAGNLQEAIATAQQIPSASTLSGEAQTAIARWNSALRDRDLLNQAYRLADNGSAESLESAIRTANSISSNASQRPDADQLIRNLSWQLLELAQSRAWNSLSGAIEIAERIPRYAEAHSEAQRLIRSWDAQRNPPPTPQPEPEPEPELERKFENGITIDWESPLSDR
ncbi:chromosome segregation ATPase [Phormidium yuhuli AB48]|uniref:Chromosome segregation ATPase n=1 Tax=Phormidium yuhuli AB48 TaxID=2940671 RepID=A0ABY5AVC1_9CYAN|nr:chromosome segregation ATPase [Phormidium yuhuli]USR92800.1 chromosome segregation ATPase [Phormidium yuhuli AB48]